MTARRRGSMGDAIPKMQKLREESAPSRSKPPPSPPAAAVETGAEARRRITVYIRDGLYQQPTRLGRRAVPRIWTQ